MNVFVPKITSFKLMYLFRFKLLGNMLVVLKTQMKVTFSHLKVINLKYEKLLKNLSYLFVCVDDPSDGTKIITKNHHNDSRQTHAYYTRVSS